MNWRQLQTILWLRWRLSQNQFTRGGKLNAVMSVLLLVLGLVAVLGGLAGGILIGFNFLASASPLTLLLVWDAIVGVFLFFWMMGIVVEIQRSETIDLSKLLHLPVALRQIFLINYLASHFTLSFILMVPAMLGLTVGLAFASGPAMLLLALLTVGFLFMVTAWTYCLRGWLVALMVNKRRRRAIIVGISMAAILLGQLPNLLFNSAILRGPQQGNPRNMQREKHTETEMTKPEEIFKNDSNSKPDRKENRTILQKKSEPKAVSDAVLRAHRYLPLLWISYGSMTLRQGDIWPAVWGSCGALVVGTLGFLRAYQLTTRFYQGNETGQRIRAKPLDRSRPGRRSLVELELPGLPQEVTALATAFIQSMLRAPEVKMALMTPLIMLAIFGSMQFSRTSGSVPGSAKPFVLTGIVAFSFFGMIQLMSNLFGFDRDGFRALVLLPVRREYILFAKNLCLMPVGLGIGVVFLAVLKFVLSPSPLALLAGMLQLGTAFLVFSLVGNYVSIVAPYRIAAGSLKPTKTSTKTTFLIFVLHLLFPVALIPVSVPPALEFLFARFGWLPGVPINFLASVVLLGISAFLYRLSLTGLGALLQKREKEILNTVTQEIE